MEGLGWWWIERKENATRQGVSAVVEIFLGRIDVWTAITSSQRERLQTRHLSRLRNHCPCDAVFVVRELVEHVLSAAQLALVVIANHLAARLHIAVVVRVPLVAAVQYFDLKKIGGAAGSVPVGVDRFISPLA